ncbi:MAG: ADP-ribosylglycohydrolase family protein [Gemmataceae bacterium]
MAVPPALVERFKGCLLGLAVGDALGGLFEGQTSDHIMSRFRTVQSLLDHPPPETLYYTDDTQMMIGVAETLVFRGQIEEETLCRAFVSNYVPSRGYGAGARRVLEAMEEGRDYRRVAATHFPGGSFGNGAAMRVAPVGLLFHNEPDKAWQQAHLSALPTHTHPLGIEGAQLLAIAVSLCLQSSVDKPGFLQALMDRCQSDAFRAKIKQAGYVNRVDQFPLLGNGIQALESVITAVTCFLVSRDSFEATVGQSIMLGGDTDTIAAMAGALAGAYLGVQSIPRHLLAKLEDDLQFKGRSYIEGLGEKLYELYERKRGGLGT